ncbi:mitochondrial carrier domain-containing protein [Aspergillus recurvatus]
MAQTEAASTAKEFMVGAAGGITQVIIGQPFDIVKVRMQVQANNSAVQVARDIWRDEGALAFYKGTLPPLLGAGACITQISIVYSTYHTVSSILHSYTGITGQALTLTGPQTFLAGGLAGLANDRDAQQSGAGNEDPICQTVSQPSIPCKDAFRGIGQHTKNKCSPEEQPSNSSKHEAARISNRIHLAVMQLEDTNHVV